MSSSVDFWPMVCIWLLFYWQWHTNTQDFCMLVSRRRHLSAIIVCAMNKTGIATWKIQKTAHSLRHIFCSFLLFSLSSSFQSAFCPFVPLHLHIERNREKSLYKGLQQRGEKVILMFRLGNGRRSFTVRNYCWWTEQREEVRSRHLGHVMRTLECV